MMLFSPPSKIPILLGCMITTKSYQFSIALLYENNFTRGKCLRFAQNNNKNNHSDDDVDDEFNDDDNSDDVIKG